MSVCTIWKFPLEVVDKQEIRIPDIHTFLHVGEQRGTLCLWAIVDPNAPKTKKTIAIHGMGHSVIAHRHDFIGTAICANGALVWHVFQDAPR